MATDRAAAKSVTQKRRERERQQRIDSILDAARQVFFAKGYVRATMDEIALGAEVSKPVVYQHFKSKDELFFSLMLPVIESLEVAMAELLDRLGRDDVADGTELVRGYFRAAMSAYDRSPESFRILMLFQLGGLIGEMKPEVRDRLNAAGQRGFDLARDMFSQAMQRGWVRDVSAHELVDVLWGVSIGIIQLEDAKLNESRRSSFKQASFRLAEDLLVDALVLKA